MTTTERLWRKGWRHRGIELYSHPLTTASGPDYGQRHTCTLPDLIPVAIVGETTGHIAVSDNLP